MLSILIKIILQLKICTRSIIYYGKNIHLLTFKRILSYTFYLKKKNRTMAVYTMKLYKIFQKVKYK